MTTRDNATSARPECYGRKYEPSPIARIRDQVALFEATDGTQGNTLENRPVVILTSIGAKSGKLRNNPIMRDRGVPVTQSSIGTPSAVYTARVPVDMSARLVSPAPRT